MVTKSDLGIKRGKKGGGKYYCCTKPGTLNSKFCGVKTDNPSDDCGCEPEVFAPWGNKATNGPYYAAPLIEVRYRNATDSNDLERITEFWSKIPEDARVQGMSKEKLINDIKRINKNFAPKPKAPTSKKRTSTAGTGMSGGSSSSGAGAKRAKPADTHEFRPLNEGSYDTLMATMKGCRGILSSNPHWVKQHQLVGALSGHSLTHLLTH